MCRHGYTNFLLGIQGISLISCVYESVSKEGVMSDSTLLWQDLLKGDTDTFVWGEGKCMKHNQSIHCDNTLMISMFTLLIFSGTAGFLGRPE